jgi:general secretion pathway protein L
MIYTLVELSGASHDADITLLVPTEDCLLTSVQLPALNPRALRAAIPAALEEQLVDDIDTLHFALGERQADGSYPVAVVARAKMQAWLAFAAEAGVTPTRLVPDCFVLPATPEGWHIHATATRSLVRTGAYSGFAVSPAQLASYVTLSPTASQQYHTTDIKQLYFPYLNLLQGTFQPKQWTVACQKRWALTAKLAASLLIFVFVWDGGSWLYLNHQNQQLQEKIKAIYQRNFPAATAMVAPRERMLEKLQHMTTQDNAHGFLASLHAVSPILTTLPALTVTQVDYHAPILKINLTASSFATLANAIKQLNAAGITAKQNNAITTATGISATLLIQGKQTI